jgi:hypothetical protein
MSDPISELRGKIRNAVLLMLTVSFALGVGYQLFVSLVYVLAVFVLIRLAAAAVRKLRR